jgi:hypothetical protein
VVVGSTEALLTVPHAAEGQLGEAHPDCATLLAVEAPAHLAPLHGACILRPLPSPVSYYEVPSSSPCPLCPIALLTPTTQPIPQFQVETILYQQSLSTLQERGALAGEALDTAYVYTGVVVLGSSLAEEILRYHSPCPPSPASLFPHAKESNVLLARLLDVNQAQRRAALRQLHLPGGRQWCDSGRI